MSKIRVLVVDDSALVRRILTDILESDPEIEIVGTASNGRTAVFKSFVLDPDVITMDIEMPEMNGLEALKEIMQRNAKPVIMLSSFTQHGTEATFKALELGAVDFVPKPQSMLSLSVNDISQLLVSKVKAVARAKINYAAKDLRDKISIPESVKFRLSPEARAHEKGIHFKHATGSEKNVVVIGTSTGGPSALVKVMDKIPSDLPAAFLIVQHMPEGFTKAFAERLDSISQFKVKEAESGDRIEYGHAYLAPGHSHMLIREDVDGEYIELERTEKVSGHRPSIDVLFTSAAKISRWRLIGVIMTGMGKDGAEGTKLIHDMGGYTIAQDRETSVVYGMNRVAVEMGAVVNTVPVSEITKKIVEQLA